MPGKKIIDDILLLEMLNQGKSKKEAAKFFKVSPVAISKRVKRLTAPTPESVLEKHGLTDQQAAFAIEKAKGKTSTQAALASYKVSSMDSAKAIGSQLMKQPEILSAIEELMNLHGLSKNYRIGKLKTLVDHADPNIVHKGLDMSFKLDNSYAPEKIDIRVDHHLILEDVRRIDNEIARMEADIARLEGGKG
jgi:hypothetical protein